MHTATAFNRQWCNRRGVVRCDASGGDYGGWNAHYNAMLPNIPAAPRARARRYTPECECGGAGGIRWATAATGVIVMYDGRCRCGERAASGRSSDSEQCGGVVAAAALTNDGDGGRRCRYGDAVVVYSGQFVTAGSGGAMTERRCVGVTNGAVERRKCAIRQWRW